jgi:DNA replication ATP-dependent helicase Dna2
MEGRNLGDRPENIQKPHTLKSSSSDFGDDDLDDDLLALVDSSTPPIMNSAHEDEAAFDNHVPQQSLALAQSNLKEEPKYERPPPKDDDDDEFDDVEFGEGMEELLTQYERHAPAVQKQTLPQSSRDSSYEQPMMDVQPNTVTRNAGISDENHFSDDEFEDNDLDLDNVLQELEHQAEVGYP